MTSSIVFGIGYTCFVVGLLIGILAIVLCRGIAMGEQASERQVYDSAAIFQDGPMAWPYLTPPLARTPPSGSYGSQPSGEEPAALVPTVPRFETFDTVLMLEQGSTVYPEDLNLHLGTVQDLQWSQQDQDWRYCVKRQDGTPVLCTETELHRWDPEQEFATVFAPGEEN